jgi:hypothetical protein
MSNNSRKIVIIFLTIFFPVFLVRGEDAFTGSATKLDAAASKSDAVFIGQIEDIGSPVLKALGVKSYYGVKVKVIETLKGDVTGEVLLSLRAKTDSKFPEVAPEVNKHYIFFVVSKKTELQLYAIKILLASDSNIDLVKSWIAQSSK